MKKDTSHMLERAQQFQIALIGEGLLIGVISGLVVLGYRIALKYAGEWLLSILEFVKRSPVTVVGWFLVLLLLAVIVGRLITWEPMISGSGIPQLEGEMTGKLEQCWWKILIAKFIGGFLSLLAGLSLGREGPSIQLGAMAGKGFSRLTGKGITEERFLLTCGASAGLSAAFHAPLAGVMFSLEEVHKNFSVSVLLSVMTASLAADYLSSNILGFEPVFQFDLQGELPENLYWTLILLGILLGVMGAFYNAVTMKVQAAFQNSRHLNTTTRLFIPFLMAGVLGFVMPSLLGSGHEVVNSLTAGKMTLVLVLVTLVGKFIFSVISFGSGAPGGIFFPLLVLGALIGGSFGIAGVEFFGMDPSNVNNFVMLAMAGYFTAIVRAPLTGIILIFEMTGSVSQMLSLSIISIVAYIVANLLKSEPIYESLLGSLLKRRGEELAPESKERILLEIMIHHDSSLVEKKVRDVTWPESCLLVSIVRGGSEVIPRGNTPFMVGDMLVIMTSAAYEGQVYDQVKKLCTGLE
ncbi:MAG: ClC family H(+)/Cl(-) exchange transporter [Blautia sp.]